MKEHYITNCIAWFASEDLHSRAVNEWHFIPFEKL